MKRFNVILGMVLALVVFTAPGFVLAITIDFSTGMAGTGGNVELIGPNQMIGSAIPIGAMTVSGTSGLDGVYATGAESILAFNTSTNLITITGSIPALGIPIQPLLTGTFVNWEADANGLHDAIGPDVKDRRLLDALAI